MLKIKISLLIFAIIFSVANAEDTSVRDSNTSNDMFYGSKPSNVPTGGLFHDFKEIKRNLFTDTDLSMAPNAKLFAGYGIYDINDENCIYVDAKTSDGSKADSKFQTFKIFNNHTYAVSINDMTYSQCQTETLKYHGYPANITTKEENEAIQDLFGLENEYWIGVQRNGPCPSEYVDYKGDALRFNDYNVNNRICNDSEPYTSVKSGQWIKRDTSYKAKCTIEFDSEDWEKPLKTCAPWWSIERSYKAPEKSKYIVTVKDSYGNYVDVDIRDYNQKDFPKSIEMCTQLDTSTIDPAASGAGSQRITCNSYYDRTASPRCLDNPKQSLCKVDECRGVIKNRCQLISTGDAPLTYSKEIAFVNGEYKEIKKRVNIKIHEYLCPMVTASGNCLQTQRVTMLPQPCPGTEVDDNGTQRRPIRVYGSPAFDGPDKYDSSGTLQNLYGKCPDGSLIKVPVDILKQSNRICAEYEMITNAEEYDEMCTAHKSSQDYVVQAGINEADIHNQDDNCVRINNIEDARPRQDIRIDYQTYGFASIALVKAQIDGQNIQKLQTADTLYYDNATGTKEEVDYNIEGSGDDFFKDTKLESELPKVSCDGFDTSPNNDLYKSLKGYQAEGIRRVFDYSADGIIIDFGSLDSSACQSKNNDIGSTVLWGADMNTSTSPATPINDATLDSQYESDYKLTTLTGLKSTNLVNTADNGGSMCIGVKTTPPVVGDIFNYVKIDSIGLDVPPNITSYTAQEVGYNRCREIAICTGTDILNQTRYSGDEQCILKLQNGSGASAYADYKNEYDAKVDQWFKENTSTEDANLNALERDLVNRSTSGVMALDQIDGFTDIYAILEYTSGNFGYLSSYNVKNFKSNTIKVNGLVVQPIVEHAVVTEHLREDYTWDYTVYRNYSPDPVATIIGGVAGGATAYLGAALAVETGLSSSLTYLSAAGGPWGIVAAVVIAAAITLLTTPTNLLTFTGVNTSRMYNVRSANYRYIENPYGYELRKPYELDDGTLQLEYATHKYGISSKMEKSDQSKHFNVIQTQKKDIYKELNINMSGFSFPIHERQILTPDPDTEQWNPWAKKTSHATGAGTLDTNQYHQRPVTVHYMGATNTATIVVPYKGDYAVEAYNKNGEQVSSSVIVQNSFINSDTKYGASMAFSQVKFGENMLLSPNLDGDSCKSDIMVSVGGGVAGAYYELGSTGSNDNYKCAKADDEFVNYNSITTIKVRPLDQGEYFTIELTKPLPYPNRVFLATMGISEDRVYRCYSDFPECIGFENVNINE